MSDENSAHSFTEGCDVPTSWPLSPLAKLALVEAERLKLGVFARQVEAMRESQRNYFKLIAQAKKSRRDSDFGEAHNELEHAKKLEAIVDHAVFNILNPPGEPKVPEVQIPQP